MEHPKHNFQPGDLVRIEEQPKRIAQLLVGTRAIISEVGGDKAQLTAIDKEGRSNGEGTVPTSALVHEDDEEWLAHAERYRERL